MLASTAWWVITGLLVVAELLTGTFYLLMLALGTAAGALAAHAGLAETPQLVVTALVGGGSALAWHFKRPKKPAAGRADNPDPLAAMDVGQIVHVPEWGPDGFARVNHRGSVWTSSLQHPLPAGQQPETGSYRICEMRGNQLILEKV
jgi:membrane protein implicated in regulation of membrane protease activity